MNQQLVNYVSSCIGLAMLVLIAALWIDSLIEEWKDKHRDR